MTDFAAMLSAYPVQRSGPDVDDLDRCLQECLDCAETCLLCADACLADPDRSDRARCAAAAVRCADVVATAARALAWQVAYDAAVTHAVLRSGVEACRACYDECRKHALDHEYCRLCAEACRRCANACRVLLAELADGPPR
jgi:hypothetical protein